MTKSKRNKIIIIIELIVLFSLCLGFYMYINTNFKENNKTNKDISIITPFEGYWIGNNKATQGFIAVENNIIDYYTNDYINGFIDVNISFTYTDKELIINKYKTNEFAIDKQIIKYNFDENGKLIFDNGFTFVKVDKDDFNKYLEAYKQINNID